MPICSLSGIENCNNSHVSTYNVLTLSMDYVASNSIIKTTLYVTGHVIRSSRLPVFFFAGKEPGYKDLGYEKHKPRYEAKVGVKDQKVTLDISDQQDTRAQEQGLLLLLHH